MQSGRECGCLFSTLEHKGQKASTKGNYSVDSTRHNREMHDSKTQAEMKATHGFDAAISLLGNCLKETI